MYLAEAHSRWYSYPPPYYYQGSFVYATPWLWYDGNSHAGYAYANWGNLILNRMDVESPLTIIMWGNYNPTTRTGTIYAKYRNDTQNSLSGNVLFVVTEDSIYRSVPNGDVWHNHVARDYIPDYLGTAFEIPRDDSVIYSQSFTIASSWIVNQCEIVTFFQDTRLSTDSIKDIYQGGKIMVRELTLSAVEEEQNSITVGLSKVNVTPNPCRNQTQFEISLPNGTDYKIGIFDISGREIKHLNGRVNSAREQINCSFSKNINPGVYFYRFESKVYSSAGKIIVQ